LDDGLGRLESAKTTHYLIAETAETDLLDRYNRWCRSAFEPMVVVSETVPRTLTVNFTPSHYYLRDGRAALLRSFVRGMSEPDAIVSVGERGAWSDSLVPDIPTRLAGRAVVAFLSETTAEDIRHIYLPLPPRLSSPLQPQPKTVEDKLLDFAEWADSYITLFQEMYLRMRGLR